MSNSTGTRRTREVSSDGRKRAGRQLSCEIDERLMKRLDLAAIFSSMSKTAITEWALEEWMEQYIPKPNTDPEPAVTKLALERVKRDKSAMRALRSMARTARSENEDANEEINGADAENASTQNEAVQHE